MKWSKILPWIFLLVILLIVFYPHKVHKVMIIQPTDSQYIEAMQIASDNNCAVVNSRRALTGTYIKTAIYEITLDCSKWKFGVWG